MQLPRPTRPASVFLSLLGLLLVALVGPLSGCGGDDSSPVAVDQQDASAVCPGTTLCGGKCVDLQTDSTHCGACEKACSNTQMCASGACVDDDASLSALSFSSGTLSPAFSAGTSSYVLTASSLLNLHLTATSASAGATLSLDGAPLASGAPSGRILRAPGDVTVVTVKVTAASGATKSYGVVVLPAQNVYAKASNAGAADAFGVSVAIDGDTLVVGAPSEASSATGVNGDQSSNAAVNSGAVYVFTRTGGGWAQQAYLKSSNTGASDQFGVSVAVSGNIIAVGAPYESSNSSGINGVQSNNLASNSGAVYVFARSGGVWSQQAYVKASNTGAQDRFGTSVALLGETLAVGAPFESSSATGVNGDQADNATSQSGAVYVFTRSSGIWTQQAYVKASNTGVSDYFGWHVALSTDVLAVGAPGEASKATGVNGDQTNDDIGAAGAVYVFARTGTTWAQQAYVKASNPQAGTYFGWNVAISGDTLAASTPYELSNATGINGDQSNTLAPNSGAVYVFARAAATWSQQAYVKASNTGIGDQFGFSIALSGDTLVVGALHESSKATDLNGDQSDNSALDNGAVYVFGRAGGAWAQQAYVKGPAPARARVFGSHVALSGESLAVGVPGDSSDAVGVNGDPYASSAPNSGAVYVMP